MNWNPSMEERKYLELVISMTTDCLIGKGTVDLSTYTTNLCMICAKIKTIANNPLNSTTKDVVG